MIFTDRTITVQKGVSSLDETVVLYRGDKGVEIRFTLNEKVPFKFGSGTDSNIIEKTEAAYGQLVIKTPNGLPSIFSEVTATKKGAITFTITAEMIDEITEVGSYTFQIRLLDENKESRVTLPEVVNGIEIREPIASEDTNKAGVATVGNALTTAATTEDVFDSEGNYNETTWQKGDRITDAKLNKIEQGITGVNKKVSNVDLSNYVTKDQGNANQITFSDGQTFQAKLDAGTLKGDKGDKGDVGPQGPQGIQGPAGTTTASGVSITDTANNFTATDVEGALQEVGSQIKEIANVVSLFQGDNDTIKLQNAINYTHENGGGNIIIDKDINLVDTIIIKDNVNIYSKKSKIISNTDKIPIIIKGNNVSMNGITINCNKISNVGIYVDSYIRNINITECEVFNIDTEAEAYGIYISSYGCSNIKIHKCNVHDIKSTADGVVAVRGGGWSKGIIIDRADYVNGDVSKGKDLNTKDIIISENIIENILPYEDSEAIYIEGNSIKNIVNAKILNNTIKNFGKRAIKILPCSEITISNNYIEDNLEDYSFAFISFFATNATISNNSCIKTNNYIENGIEIGYDVESYIIDEEVGNIIITNNNLLCGNTGTNYGIVFKHKQVTTSCIISNNNIQNFRYGVAFKTSDIIKNVNINNNIFTNITGTAIYNRSNLSTLTVDGNIITGSMTSSGIDINVDDSLETKKIEYVIIRNNFINKTDYAGVSVSYGDTIKILNNNFYCNTDSVYIDTERVTNYYVQNTINLKNNKFSKYDTFKEDSNLILMNETNTTLTIPTILSKMVIVKYLIANTIDDIVANNGTVIVLTTSAGNLTINNSTNIALKNSTNVTLAFQQAITLIRLDNRWLEISRNF